MNISENRPSTFKKGATKHCAYGTCNSDSRYMDRPSMSGVFFMRFPQFKREPEKCKRWARACCRQGFDENSVKKDTYICSLHFVGENGPVPEHPDPIPATATKFDVERMTKKPRRKVQRRLVLSPITLNEDTKINHEIVDNTTTDSDFAEILLSLQDSCDTDTSVNIDAATCQDKHVNIEEPVSKKQRLENVSSVHCQTDVGYSDIRLRINNKLLENENKLLKTKLEMLESVQIDKMEEKSNEENVSNNCFGVDDISGNDEKSKFYTGLFWCQFLQLWRFVSPAVEHLRYWYRSSGNTDTSKYKVSPKNALLMTLMRLRQGYTAQDLAYRFGVSPATVKNVVLTWIQFLYKQFLPLRDVMFAPKCYVKESIPKAFKKYKDIRCVIDCTEFFVQRPSNFHRQGNLYSTYKSHTTYKVLVAVAPNGAIMFVSDVYEGSISDRDIVLKSGFLNYLEPGDTVMADRGFNIQDILNERKVNLIIPPFLAGRNKLTPQEEALTKDVAKHRIHVERAIERIKKFRLLQKTIPLFLEPVISQMIFIVCCLVNFQTPLVK